MKKVLVALICIIIIPAVAMADLTGAEISLLREIFNKHQDRAENDEDSAAIISTIISGSEEARKALIVQELTNTFLPRYRSELISYEKLARRADAKITAAEAYIAAQQ